jgi:hypothetical protein
MPTDTRYKTVKILIEGGHITTFAEIFNHIPKSTVIADFGGHYSTFNRMVSDPSNLKMKEIFTLARLFEVDDRIMVDLVFNHIKKVRKKKG